MTREFGERAPKPGGRLLTVAQAAKQLDLSVAMVRRYCSNGQLAASKVGRDWAIRQRDVEAFVAMERQRQKLARQAHAQPA
ncbi:helix-turn-helix domain-containing protein [Candidatus Woesearchaeota archaeon]|nr:helix-turn-helix domain-containing protein [Candidatus Woesearchaeota archaeon]